TPEWIEGLVRPVYKEKFDFVSPIYHRQKFDGLLVKNVLAPLVRGVYGCNIREPVGGEFCFSGRLAGRYLEQDVWHNDLMSAGVGLWMTTTAIVGGFRLGQSFLGPRIHQSRPKEDLVQTIRGVVGDLFRCLENQESYWISQAKPQVVPEFGFQYGIALEPIH